ncbi:hypothetical protein BD410DRAFT_789651 [Rickenella mellea]|uniref:Uncharacterized protein n=1 Tax=Rickenella mellea TaxID=50990 RepID=A0A4Y7Q291_9AGAM|nr:hypothetical protein BD410DRAFT_789651 [Rickenella mellea]
MFSNSKSLLDALKASLALACIYPCRGPAFYTPQGKRYEGRTLRLPTTKAHPQVVLETRRTEIHENIDIVTYILHSSTCSTYTCVDSQTCTNIRLLTGTNACIRMASFSPAPQAAARGLFCDTQSTHPRASFLVIPRWLSDVNSASPTHPKSTYHLMRRYR